MTTYDLLLAAMRMDSPLAFVLAVCVISIAGCFVGVLLWSNGRRDHERRMAELPLEHERKMVDIRGKYSSNSLSVIDNRGQEG